MDFFSFSVFVKYEQIAAFNSELTEKDTVLAVLPFFHIYGMVVIMGFALFKGMTIVVMPKFEPTRFLELIQQEQVTMANLVPPIILFLAKHPLVDKYNLKSLRRISKFTIVDFFEQTYFSLLRKSFI
jgi:acyl-CoA synthetase (AMP-forming)/AMP-acid ligase II